MNFKKFFTNKETKNAGWIIGGKIVQMVLSLVVGVLTARYLGPGNQGLINYGAAYVAFFSALSTLGLNSVMVKDFVDNPEEQGEAIGSALVMKVLCSVLSCAMIAGLSFIVDGDEPITVVVVVLCSLGTLFKVFETFNYWFQNQYKSKIPTIATLVAYAVTSAYKIVLLVLGKDVRWFALATSVDYIVIAVLLIWAYRRHGGPKLKFSLKKSKSLLKISYNYILSTLMVVLYGQTDKFMLKQLVGSADVGYYGTAIGICAMWTFVLQAIIDSLYPTILRLKDENYEGYEKKNKQLYAIVFYVSCFVSVGFVLLGDFVVDLLYGTQYLPAVPVLKMVTWYTAFSFLGVARNAWIVSEGKQRYLKYMYGSAVMMNIALNWFLIPIMGASGAALASLITEAMTSLILPLFIKELRPNAKLMLDAICLKGLR